MGTLCLELRLALLRRCQFGCLCGGCCCCCFCFLGRFIRCLGDLLEDEQVHCHRIVIVIAEPPQMVRILVDGPEPKDDGLLCLCLRDVRLIQLPPGGGLRDD